MRLAYLAFAAALASIAVTPVMAAPTASSDTKPESNQPVGDTWITTKVKSELLADSQVSGTAINVSTLNGVVTLAGVVETQAAREQAISIARNIKGVTDVDTRALKVR